MKFSFWLTFFWTFWISVTTNLGHPNPGNSNEDLMVEDSKKFFLCLGRGCRMRGWGRGRGWGPPKVKIVIGHPGHGQRGRGWGRRGHKRQHQEQGHGYGHSGREGGDQEEYHGSPHHESSEYGPGDWDD